MNTFKGIKIRDKMIVTVVKEGIKYPDCMIVKSPPKTYLLSNFCFAGSKNISRPYNYGGRVFYVELNEKQFDRIEVPGGQSKWANQALRNRLIEKNII